MTHPMTPAPSLPRPNRLNARLEEARALHMKGRLEQARRIFESIVATEPGHAGALGSLAVIAGQSRDFKRAVQLFDQLVRLTPGNPAIHCNRGLALHELGEYAAALVSYERAIALKPDYAVAYYNRGNAQQALGRADAALASFDEAIAAAPHFAEAHYNRGVVLQQERRWQGAVASYRRAIEVNPGYTDAHYNLGVTLQELAQWAAALASYERTIALDPRHARAHANRGVVLSLLRQSNAALESFDHAIGLDADFANAYFNRGNTLSDLKRFPESIASYDRALALGSDGAGLYGSRRHAKLQICDWRDHDTETRELTDRIRRAEAAAPPFHVLLMTDSGALQRQAAENWVRRQFPEAHALPRLARYPRHDKVRVGYFSADFHDHATLYLMAELFERHDRGSFEIFAFSFGPDKRDGMRARLTAACAAFHDVRLLPDAEIAQLARTLQIDIAVDLKGFTQFSRPGIFAHRAAPVQMSYLGYPGTMGAGYMDYLIADRTLIPEAGRHHYREKIIILPDSYQVNDGRRLIADRVFSRAELGLPPGGFVYCCFNNNFKITPGLFDVWMRILKRVGGSVLWLYEDNPMAAANLRREAAQRNVDPTRLVFAPFMPLADHLARHRAADLFLDTVPYNAHTTASDALWSGLPVLTLCGEAFASRVAASLLTALRLPELITLTQADYENLAVALAGEPPRLAELRERLAQNRRASPLFDSRRFTKHIEAAYLTAYERHHAGLPPDTIVVPPTPNAPQASGR
jgi:predicted O-linked N-acetylglucosamine transferase (SPINDLY family)